MLVSQINFVSFHNMILASVFINALSIVILYSLVYTLFYSGTSMKFKMHDLETENTYLNNQIQNLVQDTNYNNRMLKHYLNKVR
jgi:outer membrane murein-binding lipoprotein Lpp